MLLDGLLRKSGRSPMLSDRNLVVCISHITCFLLNPRRGLRWTEVCKYKSFFLWCVRSCFSVEDVSFQKWFRSVIGKKYEILAQETQHQKWILERLFQIYREATWKVLFRFLLVEVILTLIFFWVVNESLQLS